MSLVRTRAARCFAVIGRVGDLVIVVSVMLRLAQRKGWLSDDQATQLGLAKISDSKPLGEAELAIAAVAIFRLLRSKKPRK
jgi:hypothetical protein